MIIKISKNSKKKKHFIYVNTYYDNNDTNISTILSTTHIVYCTKDGTVFTKTYIYLNDVFFEAESL